MLALTAGGEDLAAVDRHIAEAVRLGSPVALPLASWWARWKDAPRAERQRLARLERATRSVSEAAPVAPPPPPPEPVAVTR